MPLTEEACDVSGVAQDGDGDHNVEIVDVTDLGSAGEVTCANASSEDVGDRGGYIAARIADEATGRRSLALRIGPEDTETTWIDDPAVFPVMANGWQAHATETEPELFLFATITATDPSVVDPIMAGRLLLVSGDGERLGELAIPRAPSSFIHDVCRPSTAVERFHVITSAGANPFASPEAAMTTPEDLENAAIETRGCATSYRDSTGWAINQALGNACTCEQLPGETCSDPCFESCVFGQNGAMILSDPVCGPNEECTGAAGVGDPARLADRLGLGSDSGSGSGSGSGQGPEIEYEAVNCVPLAKARPNECELDIDCDVGGSGPIGTFCHNNHCVDCRSDSDCEGGNACTDGNCAIGD